MKNKITFLFGAGISIPAKVSSTSYISKFILNGKGISRGTAENYIIDKNGDYNCSIYKDTPDRVKNFLRILKDELTQYYNKDSTFISYEDLYNLLDFINRNYHASSGNPAFKYLLDEFEPKIRNLLLPYETIQDSSFDFKDLLKETFLYINDIVQCLLSKNAKSFIGLNLLNEILIKYPEETINIFTLNHDTVIEQFLNSKNIVFNDGFEKCDDNFSFWNPDLFDEDNKINLYKIHGSVNWHYFDEESWEDRRICKVSKQEFWLNPRKSILLIGIENKFYSYTKELYLELYYRFYKNLSKTNFLVVSGYGFGDQGINDKIWNWLLGGNNKMIIINPLVENLKSRFPSFLYREWDNKNKIIPIDRRIENVSLETIKAYFQDFDANVN